MTLLNKILIGLLGLVVFTSFGFIIYQQHQMTTMQQQISASVVAQQTLLDGITRSQSQYVTKADLDAFAAANNISLATIQQNVSALGASITGVGQVTVNSGPVTGTNIPSSSTTPSSTPVAPSSVTCNGQQIPCPNSDPFGYQKNVQTLQLAEPFSAPNQTTVSVPVGTVAFDATKATPWTQNLYQRSYDVSNVLATDQDGKQYVYNQVAITTNGQTYKAPITTANYVQQYPTPSFSFWNPRLFLGIDGGLALKLPLKAEVTPNVSFGFMSYGKTKVTPDWSFLQVGAGYGLVSQKVQLEISPVQLNMHLPFMNNTFIGPSIGYGVDGNWNAMLGFRVAM